MLEYHTTVLGYAASALVDDPKMAILNLVYLITDSPFKSNL